MPNPSPPPPFHRFWKSVGRAGLIAGAVVLAGAAAICVTGQIDDLRRSDVAVVLGNAVLANGQPSPRLAARLDEGAAVWRAGLVRAVIVSGEIERNGEDESAVMRRYLLAKGVPASAIIVDPSGINTLATARDTAAILKAHGWRTAMAVTQYYHIPRTRLALDQYGIKDVRSAHAHYFERDDLPAILREVVAYPVYVLGRPRWI